MMELLVKELLTGAESLNELAQIMDGLERHPISEVPWAQFPYKPKADVAVACRGASLFLKYYVQERSIRAAHGRINEPVYEDACVEFFISFGEAGYYNFEFNCIGTVLAGWGAGRAHRQLLPVEMIRKIRCLSVIRRQEGEEAYWELLAAIPGGVFLHQPVSSWKGMSCRGNFYKCGDGLPEPHFLCWSPVGTPEPDFHRPEFFGRLVFG